MAQCKEPDCEFIYLSSSALSCEEQGMAHTRKMNQPEMMVIKHGH